MNESLYAYYERELRFIRQMAQQFAQQYPASAGRLALEKLVIPELSHLIREVSR